MNQRAQLSNGILSVLPLIYVSWSDSVLSPSEVKAVQKSINSLEHLSLEDKSYLNQWTNPADPPSENEFKFWAQELKRIASRLDVDKKKTIVELATEIAFEGVQSKNGNLDKIPKTKLALVELANLIGLNEDSSILLLEKIAPEKDSFFNRDYIPNFDVKELTTFLDGKDTELRHRIRKLLRDPLFEIKEERDKELYRKRILVQLKALADQGYTSYSFPKKYGGFEKHGEHITVFEMLGYGDMSLAIKFGVQIGLFGGALYQLGTEQHHRKYLEAMHKCELLGCFAMTETGHGSNVKDLETTATYDHSTKSITVHSPSFSAGKEYIGNAMHSSIAAVFSQLIVNGENHGVHTVLVPLRDKEQNLLPGIKIEDCGYKMGLNGVDNGRIWFDNVSVPLENLLNKFGGIDDTGNYNSIIANPSKRFFTTLGALVVGRICVGMLGLNASKTALNIAINYAYHRRQFGHKGSSKETLLIEYPTHQDRLFPLLAKTYAYHFALQDLAEKHINAKEDETREIETLAAGLKAKATWHATSAIQTARECCGGKGYLSENRLSALKADTDIFTTFEGDNTVLMQLVAKGVLTEYKQSFHDDGYRAVMRFLLTKAKHEAYEYNPLFTRNTDTEHLLDPRFHFHAFNYRYRKTLISLSERMQKYLKRGLDTQQAFLKVQTHMLELADAFIDKVVLNSFYNRIENCENKECKQALLSLVQCFALTTIQENGLWYLQSDYMDGSKTKAIRRLITKLYQDIKLNSLGLVAAFAIPEELIQAPIALKQWS